MKLNIIELRDMVARAVRQTLREAKKAKLPAERSAESIAAQRDRHVRGLPGFAHSAPLDMSKPLGKRSKVKRQGASNIGNWTSESRGGRMMGLPPRGQSGVSPSAVLPPQEDGKQAMFRELVQQGIPRDKAARVANALWSRSAGNSLGEAAVRKLVGMIVDEEVRVAGRR